MPHLPWCPAVTVANGRALRGARLLPAAGGAALLLLGVALPTGPASAQLDKILPNAVQKMLPGATQDDSQTLADGKRACERYAQDRGLDVRRIRDARPSGKNNVEVTLDVESHSARQDYLCTYDTGDQQVRTLERSRTTEARSGDVSETLARRARQSCEDAAQHRDYSDVEVTDVARAARKASCKWPCAPAPAAPATT